MVYHFLMACNEFKKSRNVENKLKMEAQRTLAMRGRTRGIDEVIKSATDACVAYDEALDGADLRQAEDTLIQQVLELSLYSEPASDDNAAVLQLEPIDYRRAAMMLADQVANLSPRFERALAEELDNSALSLWSDFVHNWSPEADSRRIRFLMEIV